ncbi:hypothetical protein IV203_035061 [Nitzschia inconspicua]|uniref:Uncharacterized protein n=1 Tax=Nitzschia inconspicua TaxID=303405 RepID=A0A9K3LDB8_9STRA|nr:hypothetical protein IV203_035061 [Nitzschia inconspicua]
MGWVHKAILSSLLAATTGSFVAEALTNLHSTCRSYANTRTFQFSMRLYGNKENSNRDEEAWDAYVDYDAEWPQGSGGKEGLSSSSSIPDPTTAWDALPNMPAELDSEKLGIDLKLEPLTQEQAQQLQEDASQVINDAIDAGIQDIERMRSRMNREIEASKRAMQLASDLEAKQQQEQLLNKIDKLTSSFLSSNEQERKSTQLAAAANRAMEGTGRGLEMGTWGVLNGRSVVAGDTAVASSSLLGSVVNAVQKQGRPQQQSNAVDTSSQQNRILVIADTKQDSLAKQLLPVLVELFESKETQENIPGLQVDVLAPTSNMPLGGNNAACVIVFCTSISQSSSLNAILDRLLRKTLQANNQVGTPPTQLVGISTLGTERSDKFPYSMQNLMGGKLDTRRQIEEVLINTVRNRVTEPPLDFTLIKMKGDKFSPRGGDAFLEIAPGDVLDDATSLETAAQTILQAVAYQPAARNSTLSVSGCMTLSENRDKDVEFDIWQELFLPLDGPEVWRSDTLYSSSNADDPKLKDLYNLLVEYLKEWGDMLASSGKGLTTPIQCSHGFLYETRTMLQPRTILKQDGLQLLFLPTATGKNYMNREEEMARDKERNGTGSSGRTTQALPVRRKVAQEGGIDLAVEVVKLPQQGECYLRVRARRCNYAEDAIIKELSEATIVKRLEDAMNVWKKEQQLQ